MTAFLLYKNCDSRGLFSGLKIAEDETFEKHLNKYNLIHINMQQFVSRTENIKEILCSPDKTEFVNLNSSVLSTYILDFLTAL